ncbi:hypothetical protein G9P44_000024 [Scheffersomyces stipitis]|nr:hypothetical protein G9P44_000024 [Scheffersomyces stipitis]
MIWDGLQVHWFKCMISALIVGVLLIVKSIILPPSNFPKSIPTIPFYVSFLGAYTSMDQEEIYNYYMREKLEKYGAAKLYFASRWNIVIIEPELLLQLFKNENIYAKSGNQEKIPYSVLAQYTGENIISAHGEKWRLYRRVVASSVQFPNMEPIVENSKRFLDVLHQELINNSPIEIIDLLQRYTLANIGDSVLGVKFNTMEEKDTEIHKRIKHVKRQIFQPLYMNFPFLDKLPIASRMEARKEVAQFRSYFSNILKTCQNFGRETGASRLRQALDNNTLTEKEFTDNGIILMVAGHENPLLLLLSLFYIVAKYPEVQQKIRQENGDNEAPYLNSVICECLRMLPPLGQIINRRTTENVILGSNIRIPKGTYVGYNNFGTGRHRKIWGESADEFKPERWGKTPQEISRKYLEAKIKANLPAFHGRKRACLGEKFALEEVRVLIQTLLQMYQLSLDPNWVEKITPAGPICPLGLKIKFKKIEF